VRRDKAPETKHVEGLREGGQSIVEFVLVLPVLLIILAGLLDLGRLYFAYVAVTDVAGEGAGYASAFLPLDGGGVCPAPADVSCPYDPSNPDPDGNDRRYLDCTCDRAYSATSRLVAGDELEVLVTVPSGSTFGSPITVTVRYAHTLLTPLVGEIVGGGTLPLTAYATERVRDPSTE
jgi:hypothetical protein